MSHTGKIALLSGHSSSYASYDIAQKGIFFIFVEGLPSACGNGMARIAISDDHPLFSTVVSSMMVAKTTGVEVTLTYVDECTIRGNSWDFGSFSF